MIVKSIGSVYGFDVTAKAVTMTSDRKSGVSSAEAKVWQQDGSHVTIPSVDSVILPQQLLVTLEQIATLSLAFFVQRRCAAAMT